MARPFGRATELALLVAIAALAGLGVNAALQVRFADVVPARDADTAAPTRPTLPPLADYAVIADRDIFNPGRATGPTAASTALRLRGVGLHGGAATAAIEDTAAHRQDLYRVGDRVAGAEITGIEWDRVLLNRAGVEETLELARPDASDAPAEATPAVRTAAAADEGIRQTGANAYVVDRRELTGAADDLGALMTQVRAVAEEQDGRPAGFRLFRMDDDSLFRRLGLQNGDVVQRVNGAPIADPSALLGLLQRLRTEPRVAVDIVRAGTARTLVYEIR